MHVESRLVEFQQAEQFERELQGKGYRLVDKITEELLPGEYLKMGVEAPENFVAGGITFAWKE